MADKRKMKQQERRTLLKFRVVPLVRMPKSVLFQKIREACRSGVVPDDIELQTLNWGKATGRSYRAGNTLNADDAEELRNCYNVMTNVTKDDIRFDRVQ